MHKKGFYISICFENKIIQVLQLILIGKEIIIFYIFEIIQL